jgi:hypothetical protein
MPIRDNNPFEEAQALYQHMINKLITDIPIEGGMYRPQLNFTELIRLVMEKPKAAQVATQMLAEVKEETDKAAAKQHGTWLMMALIAAFGMESEPVRWTRMMAPEFYESAIIQMRKQFGT